MAFVIWNYFLLFSPVLYSTLLFLAEISPTALLWYILCGTLEQHPEEVQAGEWVWDRQSQWLLGELQDLQDTQACTSWRLGRLTGHRAATTKQDVPAVYDVIFHLSYTLCHCSHTYFT